MKRYNFLLLLLLPLLKAAGQGLPLKAARALCFETDEGTCMNVDVSPDGKTLAFDLLGELYTLPVSGGTAKELTRGMALNIHPVWSPDGNKLALFSDRSGSWHLNVLDLENRACTTLDPDGEHYEFYTEPIWLPGSDYIELGNKVMGLAGNSLSGELQFQQLRFSADGKYAYGLKDARIYKYDLKTKTGEAVSAPLTNINGELSPDGRWWCYMTDSNKIHCLIAQDLQTGAKRILVNGLIKDDPRYRPMPFPYHFSISPDSRTIYIGYGGKIHRVDIASGQDDLVPFKATVKMDMAAYNYNTFRLNHNPVHVKYTRSAQASPDGKRVVFESLDKLYIMDLAIRQPRMLAFQPFGQFQPIFSPDGKWIAYVSWCDTVGSYLWKVPASGGTPVQLTKVPGQYQRPSWSPDGKFIAVIKGGPEGRNRDTLRAKLYAAGVGIPKLNDRGDPGLGQLQLVNIDNGDVEAVADSIPLVNEVAFSPDGNRLIYTPSLKRFEKKSARTELVSSALNGKDVQRLATGDYDTYYEQKMISPDGWYIVYSADEDLYLVPVSALNQPTVISANDHEIHAIRFAHGVDPYWEQNGKILAWTHSNHFFRVDPDKVVKAAEKTLQAEQAAEKTENDFISTTVIPDQDIPLNLDIPASYGKGLIVLKNARIISMKGDRLIEHGTIIIQDGRFKAVGTSSSIAIPREAKIYDLSGKTIIPGLIDIHLHMRVPSDIHPQQSWMYLANLAYGVTTARDPSSTFDSFGYAERLETGQMIGPRLFTVGSPVRLTDGVMRMDNQADADNVIAQRKELGGTVIKQYSLPDRAQREWTAIACQKAGLNKTNEGDYDPIEQIGMIKDGSTGVEHNPDFGDVYKDIINLYAKSGIYFTPTLQVAYGTEEGNEYFKYKYWRKPDAKLDRFTWSDPVWSVSPANWPETIEAIRNAHPRDTINPGFLAPAHIDTRMLHAGVKIALGGHGNDEGIGSQNEIWALQMGGFTNMQALRAATLTGAQALGMQQDLGSIEPGKIADLVILNSNPLKDIHNTRDIKYVMKDGILYDGDTLDELWPVYKKCPEWKLHKKPGQVDPALGQLQEKGDKVDNKHDPNNSGGTDERD